MTRASILHEALEEPVQHSTVCVTEDMVIRGLFHTLGNPVHCLISTPQRLAETRPTWTCVYSLGSLSSRASGIWKNYPLVYHLYRRPRHHLDRDTTCYHNSWTLDTTFLPRPLVVRPTRVTNQWTSIIVGYNLLNLRLHWSTPRPNRTGGSTSGKSRSGRTVSNLEIKIK